MTRDKQSFDKIEPTDIPLTQPQVTAESPASPGIKNTGYKKPDFGKKGSHKLLVAVGLILTLLLALAVVFVLPEMVRTPQLAESKPEAETTAAAKPQKPVESPWQEQQLSKARREAQDILSKLIERQQFLEKKSVQLWAAERYQEGIVAAETGDTEFRQREFELALAGYNQALSIFAELEQQVDQVVSDNLDAGFSAISAGDPATAQGHFDLVQAIEPDNDRLKTGIARTKTLPEVLGILDKATVARQNARLEAAKKHYQTALQLDPEYQAAIDGLASIDKLIVERDYVRALSRGYAALDEGKLSTAESAFAQALKLKPKSSEARQALDQARNRQSRLTLQAQLQQAQQREQEESWRAAETLYSKILRNDSSVVDARVGQIRARTRAELDEKLQQWIDDPLQLSSSTVLRNAEKTLGEARAIENRGQRLTRQIAAMQTVIIMASTALPVEFKSDNMTRVTLFRVGDLGQFTEKTLKLKPGNYVAAGTRKGYRDVRMEFQITGANPRPIVIRCEDPI